MVYIRSTIFWILFAVNLIIYFCILVMIAPLPDKTRVKFIADNWSRNVMLLLRWVCGSTMKVYGRENIPKDPCVIASNHQSAWETIAYQLIFPTHVWVLKKELLNIPIFGWALALSAPIAINRTEKNASNQQIIEQGKDRIAKKLSIMIFPQGTRVAYGKYQKYKLGAARMADSFKIPILPVATNSGRYWARASFLIYPGIISVRIDPIIKLEDYNDISSFSLAVENQIESSRISLESI